MPVTQDPMTTRRASSGSLLEVRIKSISIALHRPLSRSLHGALETKLHTYLGLEERLNSTWLLP